MNFQKTYMSRAITRAMAVDHPVGDPFGGAAYGERNDPISAAISIGTMFATGSAMMAGSVMAGIAFAGAAVSLVGNITGNKTLMQIGSIAGIVGGLGSMGAFGEAAKGATWSSLAESAAPTATAATSAAQTVTPAAASTTTPWGGVNTPTPMGIGPAEMAAVPTPSTSSVPVNAQGVPTTTGVNIAAGGVSPSAAPVTSVGDATSALNLGDATTASNAVVPAKDLGSQSFGLNPGGVGEQTFGQKLMGYGKDVLTFAKENPVAAQMAGKAVGGVTDWLSGKTDAELDYLKAAAASKKGEEQLYGVRADQLRFEIEREKQRRANLNAGYQQVNAGITVNPNASIAQPWGQQQPPGLINGVRPQ